MDINLAGIQEPKGFDDVFTQGFPITEKENNEIEVPYYESEYEDETSSEYHYETESDCTSSDECVVTHRVAVRFNRARPHYKNILSIENDFLPE